jgi:hypothetical protein
VIRVSLPAYRLGVGERHAAALARRRKRRLAPMQELAAMLMLAVASNALRIAIFGASLTALSLAMSCSS